MVENCVVRYVVYWMWVCVGLVVLAVVSVSCGWCGFAVLLVFVVALADVVVCSVC